MRVIPAKAGIQFDWETWISAFAGMTRLLDSWRNGDVRLRTLLVPWGPVKVDQQSGKTDLLLVIDHLLLAI